MYLSMTIMAGSNTISGPGLFDLIILQFPICTSGIRKSGLEKTAATAAAIIVRLVRRHINKVLFSNNRFYYKPQIIGDRVAKALSDKLAWILNSKFDFKILVPIRIYLELSFPDPLCVILNYTFYLKIVRNVEFFQSGPDCE